MKQALWKATAPCQMPGVTSVLSVVLPHTGRCLFPSCHFLSYRCKRLAAPSWYSCADIEQRWSLSIRQTFQFKSCSFFLLDCVKRSPAKQYFVFAKYALITVQNGLCDLLIVIKAIFEATESQFYPGACTHVASVVFLIAAAC